MSRPALRPIEDLATDKRKFFRPAELADYAGVTRQIIYYHIKKGALRARRIVGVIRITKKDALDYVSHEIQPQD